MDRAALEALGREELVVEARRFGVKRPEVMTRVELVDEVLRLGTPNPVERKQVRGWLGVARDLLASAVERGLNLPDAAAMIRGDVRFVPLHPEQPPVATVTLAEIYGAQGHFDRALGMLDEVLERESDHEIARRLRARLLAGRDGKRAKEPKPSEASGEAGGRAQRASEASGEADPATQSPERVAARAAEDAPDAETLPPAPDPETLPPVQAAAPEVEEATDPATLPPAAPDADEPDHATLMPARPEPGVLAEDEPDHPTLMPARPEPGELAEDEPDHPTLMPARPDVAVLGYDELEQETLIPAASAPAEDESLTPSDADGAGAVAASATDVAISADAPPAVVETPSESAVVFERTGAATASVYFEVGDVVAAAGQAIVLRVVEHRFRAAGVERVERDLPVTERRGTATIADLESGSVLRAALGRKWDGEFRAAAVGAEVRVASEGVDVTWAPRRNVDYAAVAGRSGLGPRVDA
ncbi:MAG TPA: hypothetical protein VHC69_22960 [Polyangiaceae bacterium]|nr:hypothetical protein [Polyangiaceae bacterium]